MKTVSLELSKKLKQNGYPQEDSHRYWHTNKHGHTPVICKYSINHFAITDVEIYASPTADELLDLLPRKIEKDGKTYYWELQPLEYEYSIWYLDRWRGIEKGIVFTIPNGRYLKADAVADAAAKMWLYLKDSDLL